MGPLVKLGKGETLTGGADKDSILADTMEAVFGATYLSAGPEAATALVLRLIEPLLADPEPSQRYPPEPGRQLGLQAKRRPAPPHRRAGGCRSSVR